VYAEDTLGVIRLYEEARRAAEEYDALSREEASLRKEIAEERVELLTLEAEVTEEARQRVADSSGARPTEAAVEREYKRLRAASKYWLERSQKIINLQSRHDSLHLSAETSKNEMRAATAQMQVVGAYLNFLSANKTAATEALKVANIPW
jgi:FtsZ-binding cell division protein ZapB